MESTKQDPLPKSEQPQKPKPEPLLDDFDPKRMRDETDFVLSRADLDTDEKPKIERACPTAV